jgi:signal transduction histidine kinase
MKGVRSHSGRFLPGCLLVAVGLLSLSDTARAVTTNGKNFARVVSEYSLTSTRDYAYRDPRAWRLLGSNDGLSWSLLDVRTNESFGGRERRRTFSISNTQPFCTYRLQVDQVNWWGSETNALGDDLGQVQLAELELRGPDVDTTAPDGFALKISASSPHPVVGNPLNAFDRDPSTRWMDFGLSHLEGCWIQCEFVDHVESIVRDTRHVRALMRANGSRDLVLGRSSQICSNLALHLESCRRTLVGYALTSANDVSDRDPRNWTLLGSNDGGISWSTVDVRKGELFPSRFRRRVFTLSHPATYNSFRLRIDAVGIPSGPVQLGEIEPLYEGQQSEASNSIVVSSTLDNPPWEGAEKAFDADPKTKWFSFAAVSAGQPGWIQWQYIPTEENLPVIDSRLLGLGSAATQIVLSNLANRATSPPRVLVGYTLTSANDYPTRDPRDWRLLASNDNGKTWVTLDTRRNEKFSSRFQRRFFEVSNSTPYTLYRLQIDSIGDIKALYSGMVQLAEIEPVYRPPLPPGNSVVVRAQGDNAPDESAQKAFDGLTQTKWLDFSIASAPSHATWIQWQHTSGLSSLLVNLDELPPPTPARSSLSFPPVTLDLIGVVVAQHSNLLGVLDSTGFQLFKINSTVAPTFLSAKPSAAEVQPGTRVRLQGALRFTGEIPTISNFTCTELGSVRTNGHDAAIALPVAAAQASGNADAAVADRNAGVTESASEASSNLLSQFFLGAFEGRVTSVTRDGLFTKVRLRGKTAAGTLVARIFNPGSDATTVTPDSFIRVTGVVEPVYNLKGDTLPGMLWCAGFKDVYLRPIAEAEKERSPSPPVIDSAHPLTRARDVLALINSGAKGEYPIKLRGVITYVEMGLSEFYMQDGTDGLRVLGQLVAGLSPLQHHEGMFIELRGCVRDGDVHPGSYATFLGRGQMPEAPRRSLDYLMTGKDDGKWVEVEGIISSVEKQRLTLITHGGELIAWVNEMDPVLQSRLLGSLVRIRGVSATVTNARNQRIGARLLLASGEFIEVVKAAPAEPFDLPTVSLRTIMQTEDSGLDIQLAKTEGVVTFKGPNTLFIQSQDDGLRVVLRKEADVQSGDRVEVVGLAESDGFSPKLMQALARKIGRAPLPPANPVELIGSDVNSDASGRDATRGRVNATFLGRSFNELGDILELQDEKTRRIFCAYLPPRPIPFPSIPVGSRLRLEGVFKAKVDSVPDVGQVISSFEMYVNSPADILVLHRPPWWSLRHTLAVLGGAAVLLALVLGWVRLLRKQVRQRTCQLSEEIADHKRTEAQLREEILQRKRMEEEVKKSHKELLSASRQAGMAEIATNVLHNVGNVLNSVNISSSVVRDNLRKSKAPNLGRIAGLLSEHSSNIDQFINSDPKGKHILSYLTQLSQHLEGEQALAIEELSRLQKNVDHIKEIVTMQQSYARISGISEPVKLDELIEDALQMNDSALKRHSVRIVQDLARGVPEVITEKHKVLQILVNLIRNAKAACNESGKADKQIIVRLAHDVNRIRISVIDNGVGIPKENMTSIFNHGFTTKKDGHGFGLHSGAITAKELGGVLLVHSDGPGKGATFTLELPVKASVPPNPAASDAKLVSVQTD